MKSPLIYLTAVKLKNQLKEALKHPAKLIYILFLAAILALNVFSGNAEELPVSELHSLSELTAILILFYTLMFLIIFLGGLEGNSGNTPLFTQSDTHLLFPAPLSPNKVLFYGLFRQLGLSLLLGFFLLFQYAWLHTLFGITYGHLLLIVVGYALILFLGQLCAMAAYTRTSGNTGARRMVKLCTYGAFIIYVLLLLFACKEPLAAQLSGKGNLSELLGAAVSFLSTLPGLLFPVSGWIAGMVGGLISGELPFPWLLPVLTLLLVTALLLLILKTKANYYEDVLLSAEIAQTAIEAKKEGKFAELSPKKVRLGKTGIKKGWGASAIYHKHKVENRRSGVLFLSRMSLIFIICIYAGAIILRGSIDPDAEDGSIIIAIFALGTYLQLFSETLGRFNLELLKPYLYLIPEPPLKKLLYAIKETLIADCWEALVIFLPVAVILQASPLDAIFCILARISFALLFTAGNVLVERVFGVVHSKVLTSLFYFLALLLMAIPGIVLGVVLFSFASLPGLVGVLLGMMLANIPISLLVFFLCRNLLQYAELSGK